MNKSVFRGGLTFSASIASGSIAYAAREDSFILIVGVLFISFIMGLIASATGE